jgi:hypothetical protein
MTGKSPLTEFLPIRISRKQKIALRRWARQANADVSNVVRDMIEERMVEEISRRQSDVNADPVGVAA